MWAGALVIAAVAVVGAIQLSGHGAPEGGDARAGQVLDEPLAVQAQNPSPAVTEPPAAGTDAVLGLEQVAQLGSDWELSVQDPLMDATEDVMAQPDTNRPPAVGSTYVMVYMTATNTSDIELTLYDELAMDYLDKAGNQHNGSDAVAPEDAWSLPPVQPGETVTGSFVFEVPQGSTGGYWLVGSQSAPDLDVLAYAND